MSVYQDGRIQIPVYVQKKLGVKAGDKVNIRVEKGEMIVTPMKKKCVVCETTDGLKILNGQYICLHCIEDMVQVWMKHRYGLEDNNETQST